MTNFLRILAMYRISYIKGLEKILIELNFSKQANASAVYSHLIMMAGRRVLK